MKLIFKFLFVLTIAGISIFAQDSLKSKEVNRLNDFKQYYFEGKYKEAILVYFNSSNLTAEEDYYMGLAYSSMFNYNTAIEHFIKANEKDKTNAGFEYQLAKTYMFIGKTEMADLHFTNILAYDPNYLPALFDSGVIDFSLKRYTDSVRKFKKIITVNPANFLAYYNLAKVYSAMEPYYAYSDSTLTYLSVAVDVNPDYMPAVEMLGLNHINNKKYYQALRLYTDAYGKYPLRSDYYYYAGTCHEKQNEFDKAIRLYNKAIDLNPSKDNYWDHLGYSYYNLKNYDSSIVAYKMAIALEGETHTYYVNLAYSYVQVDSIKLAMEAFDMAIKKMRPDLIGNIHYQIGTVYYQKKQWKEAEAAYQTALFYDPRSSDTHYMYANTEDELKKYTQAIAEYKTTMQLIVDSLKDGAKPEGNEKYVIMKKRIADLSKSKSAKRTKK